MVFPIESVPAVNREFQSHQCCHVAQRLRTWTLKIYFVWYSVLELTCWMNMDRGNSMSLYTKLLSRDEFLVVWERNVPSKYALLPSLNA